MLVIYHASISRNRLSHSLNVSLVSNRVYRNLYQTHTNYKIRII